MHARSADINLSPSSLAVLTEGVALIAPNGAITSANPALCGLLDMPVERIVGANVLDPPWHLETRANEPISAAEGPVAHVLSGAGSLVDETVLLRSGRRATWVRMRVGPIEPDNTESGVIFALGDLTSVVDAEQNLHRLMFTDALTALASRDQIIRRVAELLIDCQTTACRVGVLHVDIDGFRAINDSFGPSIGDAVLVEVAERLRDLTDRRVEVGRVGVDEFLLVVRGDDPALAFDTRMRRLAEEVQRRIAVPYATNSLELHLTASVGAARGPDDADAAVELLAAADRALQTSRRRGRNQFRFHDVTVDIRNRQHLHLDRDLRLATARHELDVYYQPIIDLRSGELAGAEALLRWHHNERGPVSPAEFIPAAEATGAIGAISDFVLNTVATDMTEWDRDGIFPTKRRISVNISAAEFNRRDFLERLASVLDNARLDPERIELEITESLLVDDLRMAADRLRQLDRQGVHVSLDDFGTGYSSLSYLHQLPLHTLKIDRRFVGDFSDDRSGTITRTIVALAHNLGVVAVAEGLEHERQRRFLDSCGCDLAQGFLFAPPLPKSAFESFLRSSGTTALTGTA
ncbi:MAG: EAL domain-containing protein [Actinomycetia bacterium]|nr:EAL domain-containing protein [Actinomycetes bacterium]